jgi:hypothetical protein
MFPPDYRNSPRSGLAVAVPRQGATCVAAFVLGSLATPGTAVASETGSVPRFEAPAHHSTQSCPVGNGRLGAMLFGGPGVERAVVNETGMWSGIALVELACSDGHLAHASLRAARGERVTVRCAGRTALVELPLGESVRLEKARFASDR